MKFMILRKADADTEAGVMPSEDLLTAMGDYNTEMANAGVFVTGQGLKPSAQGARIKFSNGIAVITDGPFTETKELLAGYTMIEADSMQQALDWVKRWPPLDANGEVELELRPLYEISDFGDSAGVQKHVDLCERLHKQPAHMCSYLLFNGNCREAFEFYADCLGGDIAMSLTGSESPLKDDMPADMHDKVMHVCLQIGSWQLMGSDCPPDRFEKPQGFHVQIRIDDPEQAHTTFNRLAEGGTIQMPLAETFWAAQFGMVIDRFGTPWIINSGMKL